MCPIYSCKTTFSIPVLMRAMEPPPSKWNAYVKVVISYCLSTKWMQQLPDCQVLLGEHSLTEEMVSLWYRIDQGCGCGSGDTDGCMVWQIASCFVSQTPLISLLLECSAGSCQKRHSRSPKCSYSQAAHMAKHSPYGHRSFDFMVIHLYVVFGSKLMPACMFWAF